MQKILLAIAVTGTFSWPVCAQTQPVANTQNSPVLSLEGAVEMLANYTVTKDKAPEDVLAAFSLVSTAVATPDKLPIAIKAHLDTLLSQRQPTPSPKAEIKLNNPLDFALVRYENRLLEATPATQVTAYRGASAFPGAVGEGAMPLSKTLDIDVAARGRHSVGLYAAPGAKITVTIEGDAATIKTKELSVLIGAHSDVLYSAPGGKNGAQRLPSVTRSFPIEGNRTLAANAVGGLVYIVSPAGTIPGKLPIDHNDKPLSDKVRVKIEGAVVSPLFWQGQTSDGDWKAQLAATRAPWAEVGSDWMVLTMPIEDARTITDPEFLMKEWNRIGQDNYSFIGYPQNHVPIRPERMVGDVQISAGGAHAGYPIMTPRSWAKRYSDPQQLKNGNNWGLYHEFGHNFQDPDWSFAGNGEVSVNLFVFRVRKEDFDQPLWEDKLLAESRAQLKATLAKGENPWEKGDNFGKLLFWYDIANELGFAPLRTAFSETQRSAPPKDEAERRVLLMTRLSRAAGKSLGPYFEKWGILPAGQVPEDVAKLPIWLPVSFN